MNSELTLLYFYSATMQSMAALLAISGMFAVYRLQIEENRIKNLYINMKELASSSKVAYFTGDEFGPRMWIEKDIKKRFEGLLQGLKNMNNTASAPISQNILDGLIPLFHMYIVQLEKEGETVSALKNDLRLPIFLISLIFLSSMVALAYSNFLASKGLGPFLICFTMLFSAICIFVTVRYILLATSD